MECLIDFRSNETDYVDGLSHHSPNNKNNNKKTNKQNKYNTGYYQSMPGDNIQQLVNNDVHYFDKQAYYQSM